MQDPSFSVLNELVYQSKGLKSIILALYMAYRSDELYRFNKRRPTTKLYE